MDDASPSSPAAVAAPPIARPRPAPAETRSEPAEPPVLSAAVAAAVDAAIRDGGALLVRHPDTGAAVRLRPVFATSPILEAGPPVLRTLAEEVTGADAEFAAGLSRPVETDLAARARRSARLLRLNGLDPADHLPPDALAALPQGAPTDTEREEPEREEPEREEPEREEPAREEPAREEPAREEPAREEPAREEPAREEPAREEPAREEPAREEPAREEPAREEPAREEPAREEPAGAAA